MIAPGAVGASLELVLVLVLGVEGMVYAPGANSSKSLGGGGAVSANTSENTSDDIHAWTIEFNLLDL